MSEKTFVNITQPLDRDWINNIYFGPKNPGSSHGHIIASGAIVDDNIQLWYFRDVDNRVIIRNGQPIKENIINSPLAGIPLTETRSIWNRLKQYLKI